MSAASTGAIDIFQYSDYRAYLRDYYAYQKALGRGFSYRVFSKRAGLGSPNHLKRVMEGERNLTDEMAQRFATACRLEGDAVAYFCLLVKFTQSHDSEQREEVLQRMIGLRSYRQAHRLAKAEAAYHSTWYLAAIRELVLRPDFLEDPEWIARTLLPNVSRSEALRGLRLLLELGFIVRDEQGRLKQATPLLSTGAEVRGLHIIRYHREMMKRASESIDLIASTERDISSLTLGLSVDGLQELKQRLQQFRKELMSLAVSEENVAQVVQLNLQLFPLSNRRS